MRVSFELSKFKLDIIKENIGNHFEENYKQIGESDHYDPIGAGICSARVELTCENILYDKISSIE